MASPGTPAAPTGDGGIDDLKNFGKTSETFHIQAGIFTMDQGNQSVASGAAITAWNGFVDLPGKVKAPN